MEHEARDTTAHKNIDGLISDHTGLAKDVGEKLARAEGDLNINEGRLKQFRELAAKDGDNPEVIKSINEAFARKEKILDEYGKISDDKFAALVKMVRENKATTDDTHALVTSFLATYKDDRQANYWISIGGLIAGLIGLALGAAGLGYAVESEKKKKSAATAGDGDSGSLYASFSGANSTAQEMSAFEIEDMMQKLIVNQAVIASGEVPRERLWQNLGEVADKMEIDDQSLTLLLLQEAAVGLPGTSEFFWLDPSDAEEQYKTLRCAYKKSKKLADVYLAATTIKYRNKEVPTFHMALLLQCALGLIKHDILFPDTPTPAPA
jgi:hypothetical protein